MQTGTSYGSYKVVEASDKRFLLRPDYIMGLFVLVAGAVFLLLDIILLSPGTRHLLWWAPNWFKGAMVIIPPLGFFWFFVMTGRSILIDVPAGIARRTKFFFFGKPVSLAQVTSVQLEADADNSIPGGQYVKLTLVGSGGSDPFLIGNEKASADDFDSLTTTDFAKLLAIARHVSGMIGKPLELKGDPARMSPINRKMLLQAVGREA